MSYIDYQTALFDSFMDNIMPVDEGEKIELGKVLKNEIFDLEGPRKLKREPSKTEQFLGLLFQGYSEIISSYNCLRDIEFYIQEYPYDDKNISEPSYLKYHLQNYLHETYIQKERLIAYLNGLNKEYRRDINYPQISMVLDSLKDDIYSLFENISSTRSYHVHENRYEDTRINRLERIELFTKAKDSEFRSIIERLLMLELPSIREEIKQEIKESNVSAEKILDYYFGILYDIVFDESGNINYPFQVDGDSN